MEAGGFPAGCARAPLEDVTGWLERYRAFWEDSLGALADHLRGGHLDAAGYEQARQGWLVFFDTLAGLLAA